MKIPKSWAVMVMFSIFTVVSVVFLVLAVLNLFTLTAVIPSILWLIFITHSLNGSVREEGGVHQYLKNWAGEMMGRDFVETEITDTGERAIRFGHNVFGHRLIRLTIPCKNITSLGWTAGQATGRMGRDMNDWMVWLRHDLEEPVRLQKERLTGRRISKKDIYVIGLSDKKIRTEAFGFSFMEFLRKAGVEFIPGEQPNDFIRKGSAAVAEPVV